MKHFLDDIWSDSTAIFGTHRQLSVNNQALLSSHYIIFSSFLPAVSCIKGTVKRSDVNVAPLDLIQPSEERLERDDMVRKAPCLDERAMNSGK